VLFIDECSFLIEEMLKEESGAAIESTSRFLKWLKRIRSFKTNICFVFSGSIKISVFERMINGDAFFNDCSEYPLGAFDLEAATNLVEGLFYSEGLYPPGYMIETIIEQTAQSVPYFLQIVTDEAVKYFKSYRQFPDKSHIRRIIDEEIIGTECRRYLDQLLVNLRRYKPDEQKGARAILNVLSQSQEVPSNTLEAVYKSATGETGNFEKVLDLLEYDFYIGRSKGKYFFNNMIVKKWWKTNFVNMRDWL